MFKIIVLEIYCVQESFKFCLTLQTYMLKQTLVQIVCVRVSEKKIIFIGES